MRAGHSQPVDRIPLKIELDDHDGLLADNPAVMTRLDRENLWSLVLDHAAVGVLDVNLTTDEESDVGVHTQRRSNDRLHIDGPAEARRVDHALYARLSGTSNLEPDVADFAKLRAFNGRERRRRRLR